MFIFKRSFNFKLFINRYFYTNILKPCSFVDLRLKSGLDIPSIVTEINTLLPQFAGFIDQFNNIVIQSGVNVVTDWGGSLSIDVPNSMSETEANNISKRIGIIDRLISVHGNSLNDLFQKGLSLEDNLKANNPKYVSELTDQIAQYKKLKASYKH